MDTMTVNQGFALNESITIRDSSDSVITTYLGTETLSGMVRAGRAMPSVLTFTPTWNHTPATDGIVNFALTSTQTLTLSPGQYLIQVGLADLSADFYEGYLVVNYSVGTDVVSKTYCTYNDLLTYAPWIMKLQTETGTAGFVVERALARTWLDQIIINHFSNQFLAPQIGQAGFMPLSLFPAMVNAPPSLWLREQLNLDYLVRRQNVIELAAKKALYFIGRSQLDAVNEKQERLAMWFGQDADRIASSLRAEITIGVADPNNQDTWPSVTVDCGRSSLRG